MSEADERSEPATGRYSYIPSDYLFGQSTKEARIGLYQLVIRQQPKRARLCSFKEKVDRRPIDPPPIVQLKIENSDDNDLLQSPNYFLFASLMSQDKDRELTFMNGIRTLAGSIVQSVYQLKDIDNSDAGFFIFPDISVRIEGLFRLKFTLYEIMGNITTPVHVVYSEVFQVYSQKTFPGMSESTFLTRSFAEQGVRIRIRKETRAVTMKRSLRQSDSDSDDEGKHRGSISSENSAQNSSSPIKSPSFMGGSRATELEQSQPQPTTSSRSVEPVEPRTNRQQALDSDSRASAIHNQAYGIRLPPIAVDPHEANPKKEIWELSSEPHDHGRNLGVTNLALGFDMHEGPTHDQWRPHKRFSSSLALEGTGHWELPRPGGSTESLVTDAPAHGLARPRSIYTPLPSLSEVREEKERPPEWHRASWPGSHSTFDFTHYQPPMQHQQPLSSLNQHPYYQSQMLEPPQRPVPRAPRRLPSGEWEYQRR